METKITMLNEISLIQKHKNCTFSHIQELELKIYQIVYVFERVRRIARNLMLAWTMH